MRVAAGQARKSGGTRGGGLSGNYRDGQFSLLLDPTTSIGERQTREESNSLHLLF